MQLDRAFELAVVLSWADLMKVVTPSFVRVEYRRESNSPLDHVIVWADKGKGYCDRVCDYWTSASSTHPNGMRFWRGHHSDPMAQALGFIMQNQDRFTCLTAAHDGLILVDPPGDEERTEAATWGEQELPPPVGTIESRDEKLTTSGQVTNCRQ